MVNYVASYPKCLVASKNKCRFPSLDMVPTIDHGIQSESIDTS
jgi:hypothetical protein